MKVGIIGAGQLGRMLALAGYPLGIEPLFLDRTNDTPGAQVGESLIGDISDAARIAELGSQVDVVTFDWENVPSRALARVPADKIRPCARALEVSQDRVHEKTLFRLLEIPTVEFAAVDSRADLDRALADIGLPAVLKTRRLGYDGKGQAVLRKRDDVDAAWRKLEGSPLVVEDFVPFEREVSLIGVRGIGGDIAHYPLVENLHSGGILRYSRAPYRDAALQRLAERHMREVLRHFDYVGVLAIEFFVVRGRLIANEMAPRVHNSGHWTIEGAATSQFENHLRAITGLGLGATAVRGHAAMINFIGRLPAMAGALAEPDLHFHDYGKTPRPGRKLGHCTLIAPTAARRDARLRALMRGFRRQGVEL
ncbi:MAG TPA: 5-(carboxyamino)imidazole ribonucleotide synthase [Steroidobacteraceae bacterium]|nr:5-(carboxyamino)imidazole ribonucleotide synthase [Steroidobacteraceae bacterium]